MTPGELDSAAEPRLTSGGVAAATARKPLFWQKPVEVKTWVLDYADVNESYYLF